MKQYKNSTNNADAINLSTHITKTHTLQNPHTHTHTHTFFNKLKQPQYKIHTK